MMNTRVFSDSAAIGLSVLCTLHCLMLPLLLTWLPSIIAVNVADESFHLLLLVLVIPLSIYALFMGCKQHKRYRVMLFGVLGISLLVLALLVHDYVGETGEKWLTVLGSLFIVAGHIFNFKLCKTQNDAHSDCDCRATH